MHRQTFILPHQITTVQQKTKTKLHQTIRKNNPKSLNQKHAQNKHNKQFRKNAMFLNIIISQMATASEPTTNTLFIKTQRNRTKKTTGNNIMK